MLNFHVAQIAMPKIIQGFEVILSAAKDIRSRSFGTGVLCPPKNSSTPIGDQPMKLTRTTILIAVVILGFVALTIHAEQSTTPRSNPSSSKPAAVPTPQPNAALQQKIETYLRNLYAWGPNFKLKFEPIKETPVPNLYEVKVQVSADGQGDTATFYVTKDGHFLIRAELEDITTDPALKVRKQITTTGYPSKGPADAKIALVEYADYECPSCRQLDTILRSLLPTQPQVRLIYKDFPLTQIHPWAMTAAEAARCAYHQDQTKFWAFHDLLYDNQSIITPENAYQKMQDYANQSSLDVNALKSCMADPQTKSEVNKSMTEGESLHITNTPTIFVNGRRLIGPDAATLQQFIQYDLSALHASTQIIH
jgi:protein-disulfide isomerase